MSSLFDALRAVFKAPDPRPAREIEGDIREELEFHLDEKSRELEATGLSPLEARQRAERSFGDVDSIRKQCRDVQLGERIMLQRIILVVMVVVLASVLALGWQSVRSQREASAAINAMRDELRNVAAALRERNEHAHAAPSTKSLEDVLDEVRAREGTLGLLLRDQGFDAAENSIDRIEFRDRLEIPGHRLGRR